MNIVYVFSFNFRYSISCHVLVYEIVLWNHQDQLKVRKMNGLDLIGSVVFLENSSTTKSRKRTHKVLHPIAIDTENEKDVACSSPAPLIDSICASPARRARLLNPRM
jgi:hypothetical protein